MSSAPFCQKSRALVWTLAILAAALVAAGLSSCTSGVELIVSASSPQLKQEIVTLAADYQRTKGFRITPADKPSSPRGTAVTIGWSFAEARGEAGLRTIPAAQLQEAGFSTALAFQRWAHGDTGWKEVPILWDAWGVVSSRDAHRPVGAAGTFGWKDRSAFIKAGQGILLPGGESGVRQALFWFTDAQFPQEGAVSGILLGGAERSGPAGLAYFRSLAALGRDPVFQPGAFNLMKPDVENQARTTGVNLLFGSYQWLRGIPGGAGRDFRALVYPFPQGYVMPVSMLSGRVTGSDAAAARAQEFLLWLLSPANQKALSNASGYMAANFNAANLDPNALEARNAAVGAARVVLIDPEPGKGTASESWDSLLGRILARPMEWERVLAEKENQ